MCLYMPGLWAMLVAQWEAQAFEEPAVWMPYWHVPGCEDEVIPYSVVLVQHGTGGLWLLHETYYERAT
jgi:hypothetical protein